MSRQPPLPSNEKEPTGSANKVAGAQSQFDKRLNIIFNEVYAQVIKPLDEKRVALNASSAYVCNKEYVYSLDKFQMDRLYETILGIVNRNIMVDDEGFPVNITNGERLWFFGSYVEPSYRQGTSQAHNELSVQSGMYSNVNQSVTDILLSEQYRRRIGLVAAREFNEMQGFTDDVVKETRRVLSEGIALGQSSREIGKKLKERINVSKSRADLIAQTEIPGALRIAKRDEMQDADARYGIKSKLLHMSAFKSTSRPWHISRSGNLYTKAEVDEWYSEARNACNCYCTQIIVVLDDEGKPLNMGAIDKVIRMRDSFMQ